jgi:hypothetical protein
MEYHFELLKIAYEIDSLCRMIYKISPWNKYKARKLTVGYQPTSTCLVSQHRSVHLSEIIQLPRLLKLARTSFYKYHQISNEEKEDISTVECKI